MDSASADAQVGMHAPTEPGGRFRPWSGEECLAYVRSRTDTVLLGFSTGKDSLAAYSAVHAIFPHVVLYHLYSVPGLGFVERGLRYYEDVLGARIHRLPHPALYQWLAGGMLQPPERIATLLASGIEGFDYADIYEAVADDAGVADREWWVATGVRAADSPLRRIAISQRGAINVDARSFFPVWDWRKAQVLAALRDLGVKLPVDYVLWGRSFDGLDARFLGPLREAFPEDYAVLEWWFPLAETAFVQERIAREEAARE